VLDCRRLANEKRIVFWGRGYVLRESDWLSISVSIVSIHHFSPFSFDEESNINHTSVEVPIYDFV
jgi:hypothetical protein